MGLSSFLYHTTKITESEDVGGITSQGNDAVSFKTALTTITGPEKNIIEGNVV